MALCVAGPSLGADADQCIAEPERIAVSGDRQPFDARHPERLLLAAGADAIEVVVARTDEDAGQQLQPRRMLSTTIICVPGSTEEAMSSRSPAMITAS